MDWHTIDTAPRDGTRFLAWNGFRHSIASWCDPYYEGGPGEWVSEAMRRCDPPLTHWMRLPEALK